MSKKVALGAVALAVGAAYAGATWYMGERAQQRYTEALAQLRQWLGEEAIVSQQYERGFWSSSAQMVLQWSPKSDEEGADAPAKPVRIKLDSSVRHGPLAGMRLAAAVIETRIGLDGLSERTSALLAKTSAPTLTVVQGLTGNSDAMVLVPAGEIAEGGNTVSWQALRYDMSISKDHTQFRGQMQWPELKLRMPKPDAQALDDEEEDGEGTAADAQKPSTFSMLMAGARGDFDMRMQDGLWLLMPGTQQIHIDKLTMEAEEQGAPARSLAALSDLQFKAVIEHKDAKVGWTTTMQGKGRIASVDVEALSLRETVSRIDLEAVRLVQKAVLSAYSEAAVSADPKAALAESEDGLAPALQALEKVWPKILAALPAYAMEISATVAGKEGKLQYGAQIKSVPDAALVEDAGWGKALMQHSQLDASIRLPKDWIPLVAKAAGKEAMPAEEVNALLGMGQAAGYLTQETEHIVSALKMDQGKLVLNGKAIDMPGIE